jgi:hypothetical protein
MMFFLPQFRKEGVYKSRGYSEQRKQTEFTVGDARPELDCAHDLSDKTEIVLRLVNWNRRGLIVERVGLLAPGVNVAVMEAKRNQEVLKAKDEPFLRGWEDRNSSPNVIQFKLIGHQFDEADLIETWPKDQKAYADILLLGDRPRRFRLDCYLYPP